MNLDNKVRNRTLVNQIKINRLPIIIFGAGIVGEVLFYACRDAGITIACFCDNNINKTKSPLCNIEVVHTLALKAKYPDAMFIISTADIKDAVDQLGKMGYLHWYDCRFLLREYDIYQHIYSAPSDFVEYAVATCLLCHDSYLIPDKIFMRSVDIIITERCSLRCRDCSNLMQYYKRPMDCNLEELLQSINVLCSYVDEVNEFRVIGGEPFMNKQCALIINKLIDEPKIKKIVVYTNGTIIPEQKTVDILRNGKILLIITDYGVLSRKILNFIEILKQNNISFYKQKAKGWTDCSKITRHNRTVEQQKELFQCCCAKNTITLSNGKLYRCPFSANVYRLRAVPDLYEDYVDIFQMSLAHRDVSAVKDIIKTFLLKKEYLGTCDYCQGRSFGAPEIEPAIQTIKPLEYKRYD